MTAAQIRVNGLVQGVFFRASTKEKAEELGIKGWVRNCKQRGDSVKIYVEGEEDAIDQFVQWCKKGQHNATVESIEVTQAEAKNSTSFEITD
jgi:acylphosphatase